MLSTRSAETAEYSTLQIGSITWHCPHLLSHELTYQLRHCIIIDLPRFPASQCDFLLDFGYSFRRDASRTSIAFEPSIARMKSLLLSHRISPIQSAIFSFHSVMESAYHEGQT